jgi:hypothetical protein
MRLQAILAPPANNSFKPNIPNICCVFKWLWYNAPIMAGNKESGQSMNAPEEVIE